MLKMNNNKVSNKEVNNRKAQCIRPLVKALSIEVAWVWSKDNPDNITPSITDYSLVGTAPKAIKLLGCGLSQYLKRYSFILDTLNLSLNGSRIMKMNRVLSHTTLLYLTTNLLNSYVEKAV